MEEKTKWKRIQLSGQEEEKKKYVKQKYEKRNRNDRNMQPVSEYLIACRESTEEEQKELLYRILGPVFFGERAARTDQELIRLFQEKYGIDVLNDFYEGDDHYDEYVEAQNAIAEGYSIYGGSIAFEADGLADLAEKIWNHMELDKHHKFRRINTMLEE